MFNTGFKGGVHLTKDPSQVPSFVDAMLGNRLITKQTPKDGVPVTKVMVAESKDILREVYLCFLLDRLVILSHLTVVERPVVWTSKFSSSRNGFLV